LAKLSDDYAGGISSVAGLSAEVLEHGIDVVEMWFGGLWHYGPTDCVAFRAADGCPNDVLDRRKDVFYNEAWKQCWRRYCEPRDSFGKCEASSGIKNAAHASIEDS
jgi:hypothetical protein